MEIVTLECRIWKSKSISLNHDADHDDDTGNVCVVVFSFCIREHCKGSLEDRSVWALSTQKNCQVVEISLGIDARAKACIATASPSRHAGCIGKTASLHRKGLVIKSCRVFSAKSVQLFASTRFLWFCID